MKKTNLIIALILFFGNFMFAQTWDILDKSMATYNQNDGASNNQAWSVAQGSSAGGVITQETSYVNFTKTNTGSSGRWAWVRPTNAIAGLMDGTAYSIEVKARVHPIGIADEGNYFESNQIALRLGSKQTAAPIYLKYGDGVTGGYVSTTSGGTKNVYTLNTSEWQIYRLVFHADHSKYDVYIDGVEDPLFENVAIVNTGDQNGIYFGAESYHRCNIDIEYVKMGTGDFFSKPKIVSVALSAGNQVEETATNITVTVNTVLINDGEKLLVSLVDAEDNTVVNAVEATISQDKAETELTIPATVFKGEYFVKVAAPEGKIGDVNVNPLKAEYLVTTALFVGKNLITFGNSITSAQNSWAYQTYEKLSFNDLYNGAFAGACWYKRARKAQDGDSIWTQDYSDPEFAGFSNETNETREQFQRIINNCAIVHIQKYIADNPDASPDYAVLSYGTNDVASGTMGDVEETMSKSLENVNLYTMAGALRWSIETLRTKFPKLEIYIALPIQAKSETKNADNVKKIKVITGICDALSVTYFDCFNESGITVENEAQYLRDGLHPNEAGQAVHAKYIMKRLEEEASSGSSTAIIQEDNNTESISISASVLNIGQSLQVRSNNNASLAEIALYNIAGNTVYRQPASENEYTFNAPAAAGLYILTIKLENGTSKEFKILVK